MNFQALPTLNALLNSTSAVFLLAGWFAVKNKYVLLHRICMILAFTASIFFLMSYLIYHYNSGSKHFEGTGAIRSIYFAILISHTILATVIVPLILRTLYLAVKNNVSSHRKWAKVTWPLWMYVSVTGVVIYWMLYQ